MANTAQAKKRVRQAEVHRERNVAQRSMMRTAIKKVHAAIAEEDHAVATRVYREACRLISRMAGKGLIHKNKAARTQSKLNAQIKALQSA